MRRKLGIRPEVPRPLDPPYSARVDLCQAVVDGSWTTLRVVRTATRAQVTLAREWAPELDFADYAHGFQVDQVPCDDPAVLGDAAARAWLSERGAGESLAELLASMEQGRHEMVLMLCSASTGVSVIHHVHSSALGANNGFHAIRAGGLRRHEPETNEDEILRDGLNLSRAMSFKCAAAGLPFGGSKTIARCAPFSLDDGARLGFLAYAIDRGHLITGPDMGFPPELIDVLGDAYTQHILCGPGGPLGHTGAPTAYGVLCAMRAAAEHVWGKRGLESRTVAVQGLGAVGLELAKLLAGDRAKLVVSDRAPERVARAQHEVGGIRVVSPEQILQAECDVFAPCAVGGILDPASIQRLQAAIVMGSANNQLAAASPEDEIALARQLAERGILFAPDWSYTMGGILAGFEEYVYRELASSERLRTSIERAAGTELARLLSEARASGRTPTEVAYDRFWPLVHPE